MAKGQITPSFVIAFGLVSIPVKSYKASDDDSFELRNLHRQCAEGLRLLSPEHGDRAPRAFATLNEAAKCSVCQEIIIGPRSSSDVIKGMQLDTGDFVTFTKDEVNALQSEKSKTMNVVGFVDEAEIDPRWFKSTNFLGPTEQSGKPYALLKDRMGGRNLAAIVTYTGYGHDRVGVVRATQECLLLHQCYTVAQARSFAEENKAPTAAIVISDAERRLADQLVESMLQDSFDLSPFSDGYATRVENFKKMKAEGREPDTVAEIVERPASVDLMAALTASLSVVEKKPAPAAKKETATAPARAKESAAAPKKRKVA